MVGAPYGVVPFYQADQAIVNTLCSIIVKLHPANEVPLTDTEAELYNRIMTRGKEGNGETAEVRQVQGD